MKIIEFYGKFAVLKPIYRPDGYPNANFMGTGLALSGFLLLFETVEEFETRVKRSRRQHEMLNNKFITNKYAHGHKKD